MLSFLLTRSRYSAIIMSMKGGGVLAMPYAKGLIHPYLKKRKNINSVKAARIHCNFKRNVTPVDIGKATSGIKTMAEIMLLMTLLIQLAIVLSKG